MLIASIADLRTWLNSVRRFSSDCIEVVEESETNLRIRLYTYDHRYSISAIAPSTERPRGYLGCQSSCRKPYAGEEHTRGRDLADGPLAAETWAAILADIVAHELVPLFRAPTPRAVPATETA